MGNSQEPYLKLLSGMCTPLYSRPPTTCELLYCYNNIFTPVTILLVKSKEEIRLTSVIH